MSVSSGKYRIPVASDRYFSCTKGDVGGQRTLRPYWRNYFEQTDALVWVVDSGDRMRMQDCKDELHSLLLEDVSVLRICLYQYFICGIETSWGVATHIRQQARHSRINEQHRNP